jgi:stage II sporulation protein R
MSNIISQLKSVHRKMNPTSNHLNAALVITESSDHIARSKSFHRDVLSSSTCDNKVTDHRKSSLNLAGFTHQSPSADCTNQISSTDKPKFRLWLLLLILGVCSLSSLAIRAHAQHNQALQQGIAHEIIRFHVLANSDSDEDQQLKLKVKTEVVEALAPILKDATTVTQARNLLENNLDLIKATALETIHKNGYSYPVTVTFEQTYFPLKIYGEFTFPPGTYEALRVQIGEAKGQNWWCVMFPQLCFIDSTYSIVDKESEKKLQRLLTDEEYESLVDKKTPVKVKFKLLEKIKDLFS